MDKSANGNIEKREEKVIWPLPFMPRENLGGLNFFLEGDSMTKMTERQKEDLLTAYKRHKDKPNFQCGGLKTGWALSRKGFVKLAKRQYDDWTQWEITEAGIKYVEDTVVLPCDKCKNQSNSCTAMHPWCYDYTAKRFESKGLI